jgi:hypothetical protein
MHVFSFCLQVFLGLCLNQAYLNKLIGYKKPRTRTSLKSDPGAIVF